MKKNLLFLFALLCVFAQGVWAQRVVDLSNQSDDYVAKDGDVLTGQTVSKIIIEDGATVTFSNLTVQMSETFSFSNSRNGVECEGDACIILAEGTTNTVISGYTAILVPKNKDKTLTIKGTGSLHAECEFEGAGIGSTSEYEEGGNLVIDGGNITAIGCQQNGDMLRGRHWSGPGIGASQGGSMGNITINGGNIIATGYGYSAGISKGYGGGKISHTGTITIKGGTIKANGSDEAAGIGGCKGGTGGDIFIYGGDITAYGGKYGAGIGGGNDGGGGAIWITGGTVKAYGGTDAAGIGGGEDANSGSIVINGGDVYAQGNGYGVGIGAGEDGDVDNTISINGGTVEAFGGDDINRAIGGEDDEDYSNISIDSKMKVTDASTFGSTLSYVYRGLLLSSYYHLKFEPCDHAGQTLSYAYVDENKHKFACQWCGWHEEEHTDQFSCDKCVYNETPYYAHYYEMVYDEETQQYKYQEVASEIFKNILILPAHKGTVPADRVFVAWVAGEPDANDDGILKEAYYFQYSSGQYISTDATELNFKARYVNKTLDLATVQSDQKIYDGMILTGTLNTANYPVKITIARNATVTLSGMNISGVNNSNYSWAGITCEGNATIILADGTTNTVKGFYEDYPGIYVPSSYQLTIKGTGSLNASSNGFGAGIGGGYASFVSTAGNIYIQGGNITATGGKYAAGIGCSYNNSCGDITISGGTINATGGEDAAGIGSGWGGNDQGDFSSCGTINITSNVTCVTATKGSGATNSIGAGYNATCGNVSIGGVTGAIASSSYTYFPLVNAGSNYSMISDNSGRDCGVTLKDRTLYRDGEWNTLCLPFGVTLEGSPLAGAEARTLSSAELNNEGILSLNFSEPVTTLAAGTPYIIKWDGGDDIKNPTFANVTVTATEPNYINAGDITFVGTYDPVTIGSDGDDTMLYLSSGNKLYWPNGAMNINAFRAYFQINVSSNVRGFSMNFLDSEEVTGIKSVNGSRYDSDAWFTLDGRNVNGKPAMNGIYIKNGKKVVIK